jgi:phosphopantothenoylcysteine decarboxylase/phosphopantothenate--cysteine ligase
LSITLARTTDILEAVSGDFVKVGFAAETQDLVPNAEAKVRGKGLDLIVANDVTDPQSGFGVDTNKVTLIDRDLRVEELPLLTKYEVGQRVLDRVRALFRF